MHASFILKFHRVFDHYVLACSVKCFICSLASHLLNSIVFVCHSHWCVYFRILYNTMDFYKWKLNLTWSCKWIICKRITENACWSVGVWLACCIKSYICDKINTGMWGYMQLPSHAIQWQACFFIKSSLIEIFSISGSFEHLMTNQPHAFYSSQITSFISEIANMPNRTYMLSANILHSKDNEIFPRLNNSNSLLAVHQILV